MAGLITNVLLGTLGVGSVVAGVATPILLAGKKENNTSVATGSGQDSSSPTSDTERQDGQRESRPKDPQAKIVAKSETPKSHKDWREPKDFQDHCWGNFLKGDGGELLVCLDQSEGESPKPIFYFWWKDGAQDHFEKVRGVELTFDSNNWTLTFLLEGSTTSKKLILPKSEYKGLGSLQANSHQKLQEHCRESKPSGNDYQVTCSESFVPFTGTGTKDWFNKNKEAS